jgi:hypothetical protein
LLSLIEPLLNASSESITLNTGAQHTCPRERAW